MERFKNSKLTLLFLMTIGVKGLFGQNLSKVNLKKKIDIDSSKFSLIKTDSYGFSFTYQDTKLMDIGLWGNDKISALTIPINDSVIQVFHFSYNKTLTNKVFMKLVKGTYVEDGLNYFFSDDGRISHIYSYSKGVLNGAYISYYQNGLIESKGMYKNGEKYGTWNYFNNNGILLKSKKW